MKRSKTEISSLKSRLEFLESKVKHLEEEKETKSEVERNIVKNSKYIISFFNKNGKKLTSLEVQRLAYFLEAIYMIETDENCLYTEEFCAKGSGPMNESLYNEYKKFCSLPIELDKEIDINPYNLVYIKLLYDLFKDFTVIELVNLANSKGSPVFNIYSKNNYELDSRIINKNKTKEWFESLVEIVNEKSDEPEKVRTKGEKNKKTA